MLHLDSADQLKLSIFNFMTIVLTETEVIYEI